MTFGMKKSDSRGGTKIQLKVGGVEGSELTQRPWTLFCDDAMCACSVRVCEGFL